MNYTTQTPDAAAGTDLPRQAALTGRGLFAAPVNRD